MTRAVLPEGYQFGDGAGDQPFSDCVWLSADLRDTWPGIIFAPSKRYPWPQRVVAVRRDPKTTCVTAVLVTRAD